MLGENENEDEGRAGKNMNHHEVCIILFFSGAESPLSAIVVQKWW